MDTKDTDWLHREKRTEGFFQLTCHTNKDMLNIMQMNISFYLTLFQRKGLSCTHGQQDLDVESARQAFWGLFSCVLKQKASVSTTGLKPYLI